MRENTGRTIITTVNFADGESATYTWTEAETASAGIIDVYAEAHRENASDPEYQAEFGQAQVFEYELPGLWVTALLVDGRVDTVFSIEDRDVARYHRAVREQRSMTIRYVKADGEVTRRRIEPTSVTLTKAGDVVVRGHDRRRDEARTFRADRITHTTLHRDRVTPAPSKEALVAAFQEHTRTAGEFDPRPAVTCEGWDGSAKTITADEYDRLMAARDPREPKAVDETVPYVDAYEPRPAAVAAWRGYRPAGETPGKIVL